MQPFAASFSPHGIWGRPIAVHTQNTHRYNSDVSTSHTIASMRRRARQYARDPLVVSAVSQAIPRNARSQFDVACGLFHWVRQHIRFIEDEVLLSEQFAIPPQELDKELLIVPPSLLSMPQPQGDCDDFSLLLLSMLLCLGIYPYLVTVAADRTDPHKLSHVYVCARLADEGRHLCLDAGNRYTMIPPGWESSQVTRKAIWHV